MFAVRLMGYALQYLLSIKWKDFWALWRMRCLPIHRPFPHYALIIDEYRWCIRVIGSRIFDNLSSAEAFNKEFYWLTISFNFIINIYKYTYSILCWCHVIRGDILYVLCPSKCEVNKYRCQIPVRNSTEPAGWLRLFNSISFGTDPAAMHWSENSIRAVFEQSLTSFSPPPPSPFISKNLNEDK